MSAIPATSERSCAPQRRSASRGWSRGASVQTPFIPRSFGRRWARFFALRSRSRSPASSRRPHGAPGRRSSDWQPARTRSSDRHRPIGWLWSSGTNGMAWGPGKASATAWQASSCPDPPSPSTPPWPGRSHSMNGAAASPPSCPPGPWERFSAGPVKTVVGGKKVKTTLRKSRVLYSRHSRRGDPGSATRKGDPAAHGNLRTLLEIVFPHRFDQRLSGVSTAASNAIIDLGVFKRQDPKERFSKSARKYEPGAFFDGRRAFFRAANVSELGNKLDALAQRFSTSVGDAADERALDAARVTFLGRSGEVTLLRRSIGQLPADERPTAGKTINDVVERLEAQ